MTQPRRLVTKPESSPSGSLASRFHWTERSLFPLWLTYPTFPPLPSCLSHGPARRKEQSDGESLKVSTAVCPLHPPEGLPRILLSHCFPSKASAELNQQPGTRRQKENRSQDGTEGTVQRRDTGSVCLKPWVSTHQQTNQPERKC